MLLTFQSGCDIDAEIIKLQTGNNIEILPNPKQHVLNISKTAIKNNSLAYKSFLPCIIVSQFQHVFLSE